MILINIAQLWWKIRIQFQTFFPKHYEIERYIEFDFKIIWVRRDTGLMCLCQIRDVGFIKHEFVSSINRTISFYQKLKFFPQKQTCRYTWMNWINKSFFLASIPFHIVLGQIPHIFPSLECGKVFWVGLALCWDRKRCIHLFQILNIHVMAT